MPTIRWMLFFVATSQKKRNRRIISSSTPAQFCSGPLLWRNERYEPPAWQSPVSGWKSDQSGKTRITVTPFFASSASSLSTTSGRHWLHMYMPAFFAQ